MTRFLLAVLRASTTALGAGLLCATAACVAPPPPIILRPPVVFHSPVPPRAKVAARVPRCGPPAQPVLTTAEKARLFDDFDSWQGEHRASGAVADVPPPPPASAGGRHAQTGCRVTRD